MNLGHHRFRLPVMMAPMANLSTPGMVAEASRCGALGMYGSGHLNAKELRLIIKEIKDSTCAEFGVNLFAHEPLNALDSRVVADRVNLAREQLRPFYNLNKVVMPSSDAVFESEIVSTQEGRSMDEKITVLLEEKVSVVSFCFGCLEQRFIDKLQSSGTAVIGTATTVDEAKVLVSMGVDAIVAQGSDAGGHRGSFLKNSTLIGTMSLVPQIVDSVGSIPVIAAGGIMDVRGVRAALCLGAKGVSMGTAFITCADSEVSETHKQAILNAKETDTIVSNVFTGRPARGLCNDLSRKYHNNGENIGRHEILQDESNIAPFPMQSILTAPLKEICAETLKPIWCGQGLGLAQEQKISEFLAHIEHELGTSI